MKKALIVAVVMTINFFAISLGEASSASELQQYEAMMGSLESDNQLSGTIERVQNAVPLIETQKEVADREFRDCKDNLIIIQKKMDEFKPSTANFKESYEKMTDGMDLIIKATGNFAYVSGYQKGYTPADISWKHFEANKSIEQGHDRLERGIQMFNEGRDEMREYLRQAGLL